MTNQKLYAIRTSDTGEWVVKRNGDLIVTNNPYSHGFEKEIISLDLSAPCEWVEVWVIEVKAVDEDLSDVDTSIPQAIAWEKGFRDCLRYLGVG